MSTLLTGSLPRVGSFSRADVADPKSIQLKGNLYYQDVVELHEAAFYTRRDKHTEPYPKLTVEE